MNDFYHLLIIDGITLIMVGYIFYKTAWDKLKQAWKEGNGQ